MGSDHENPVILSSVDWNGTSGVWYQPHVLAGVNKSGYWLFNVEKGEKYTSSGIGCFRAANYFLRIIWHFEP